MWKLCTVKHDELRVENMGVWCFAIPTFFALNLKRCTGRWVIQKDWKSILTIAIRFSYELSHNTDSDGKWDSSTILTNGNYFRTIFGRWQFPCDAHTRMICLRLLRKVGQYDVECIHNCRQYIVLSLNLRLAFECFQNTRFDIWWQPCCFCSLVFRVVAHQTESCTFVH